jgi:hypothetical protein
VDKVAEIGDDVLVYDAESKTFGMPDPSKDILRFLGCYSYKYKKSLVLAKKSDMLKVISDAKFLVGFQIVNQFFGKIFLVFFFLKRNNHSFLGF